METATYPPGQILVDAEGESWEVRGILGEGQERHYVLASRRGTSTRSVKVSEIGEYYAPVKPADE